MRCALNCSFSWASDTPPSLGEPPVKTAAMFTFSSIAAIHGVKLNVRDDDFINT